MSAPASAAERLQQGLTLAQAGRLAQSKGVLETILGDAEVGGQAHALLGQILGAEGRHDLAQKHLGAAIEKNASVPQWHAALGDCLLSQQRYGEAIAAYRRAVGIEPRLTAAWFNMGICNRNIGRLPAARQAFEAALKLEPKAPDILNNLGSVCFELNDVEAATDAYAAAAKIDRTNSDLLANLALCYEASNRPLEAEQTAHAALALQTENGLAILILGRLKMQARDFQSAIELFDRPAGQANARLAFSFLINKAQCFDRLGDFVAAWQTAQQAHAHNLEDAKHQASVQAGFAAVKNNERYFLESDFQPPDLGRLQEGQAAPVFFIGFPRSGTTLVERMLAHHPDVFAAPERTPLGGVFEWLKQQYPRQRYPDMLRHVRPDDLREMRQVYWRWADSQFKTPKQPVFVDKMPMNILAVGLIDAIFPDAKILCALRDPRDVILSCYFQDFAQNPSTSIFNDLSSTAEYYGAVMGYWMRMKPALRPPIHEYRYEDLVADSEKTLKQIFEFIGLDWRSDSLDYRDGLSGTHISTPSRAEINKPISDAAIGRWKNYADQIETLENAYKQVLQTYYT
jgi:tetratricopeptide (TPR) repeat protein